jgi:putative toxin-antitoxin system antitoxin component (TIGR02293 family)
MNSPKPRRRRASASLAPTSGPGFSDKAFASYSAAPAVVDVISPDRVPHVPAVRATPEALADLARHGYSDDEIWALVVPKRTLARRVASKEPLTVEETDKALRLERIAILADRVFGNPTKAHRWLRQPKNLLNGGTPLAFLASEAGARTVEEMLHQIEHGMFA